MLMRSLQQLGDEIALLSAHLDAGTARLLVLIREFDARGGGGGNGFASCAHWLSWRIGLDLGAAREKVRVAHALADPPVPERTRWPAGSCPTPRSARSRAWRRPRPRPASSPSVARVPPSTSSGSSAAGGGWTGWPRPARPEGASHRRRGLHMHHDEDCMVVHPGLPRARGGRPPRAGPRPPPARRCTRRLVPTPHPPGPRSDCRSAHPGPAARGCPRPGGGVRAAPGPRSRRPRPRATRWWCTSRRRCSRTPAAPGKRSWKGTRISYETWSGSQAAGGSTRPSP